MLPPCGDFALWEETERGKKPEYPEKIPHAQPCEQLSHTESAPRHIPLGRLNFLRRSYTAGAVRSFNPMQSLPSILSRDTSADPAKN